jgi:phospholipid transport system substrate-binding protein
MRIHPRERNQYQVSAELRITMFSRRMVTTMIGATALLATHPLRYARATQSGDEAVTFVKSTCGQLVAIVDSAGSPAGKRRRLQEVLDSSVDVHGIARFCLGRFWALATPDQQKEYAPLFHDLLVRKIADHLGEYRGVRITMGLARASADTEIVSTMVDRPSQPVSQVDWVVSTATGGQKIVDLVSEGTSLRLTESREFTSYLGHQRYHVDTLIEALRQNVAQNR